MKRDRDRENAVVECRETQDDREPVEPGVVAADDEHELMKDDERAGERGNRLGRKERKRNDDLDEVAGECGEAMHGSGDLVEVPAQRIGQRLSFVVVVKTRKIAPAGIVAQLDESRANLGAEEHPAQDEHGDGGRLSVRRAEKGREEAGFEKHGFPPEAKESLADVDDGEIEDIEKEPCGDGEPDGTGIDESDKGADGEDEAGESYGIK